MKKPQPETQNLDLITHHYYYSCMPKEAIYHECPECGEEKIRKAFYRYEILDYGDEAVCIECCRKLREKGIIRQYSGRKKPVELPKPKPKDLRVWSVKKGDWIDPNSPALKNYQ